MIANHIHVLSEIKLRSNILFILSLISCPDITYIPVCTYVTSIDLQTPFVVLGNGNVSNSDVTIKTKDYSVFGLPGFHCHQVLFVVAECSLSICSFMILLL